MPDTTRPSLLLRVRNRDDQLAWQEFDSIYRRILIQFAKSIGLEAAEIDDLVQECMKSIITNIQDFEYDPAKGQFRSWLFTMVKRKILSLRRNPMRNVTATEDFPVLADSAKTPEEEFESVCNKEYLLYCIARVKSEVNPRHFQAFELFTLNEVPARDVGEKLNMTPDHVRTESWRIRERVKDKLRSLFDEC